MISQAANSLPDLDSELFEQVSDEELALLEYYRALGPDERAAVLEAMVRLIASARQPAAGGGAVRLRSSGRHRGPKRVAEAVFAERPCR